MFGIKSSYISIRESTKINRLIKQYKILKEEILYIDTINFLYD
jgi:hypothetical protein